MLRNSGGVQDPDRSCSHVPGDARDREEDRRSSTMHGSNEPKTLLRTPNARKAYETEIESEEQEATEEEDVPEVELSVVEDELVAGTAQDDSDSEDLAVRGAHYAGYQEGKMLQGRVANPEDHIWMERKHWCSR